jgi:hypothetical protein
MGQYSGVGTVGWNIPASQYLAAAQSGKGTVKGPFCLHHHKSTGLASFLVFGRVLCSPDKRGFAGKAPLSSFG